MFNDLMKSCNGASAPEPVGLLDGLVAHYPLNNDSQGKDWTTDYDATDNGATFNDTHVDTSVSSIVLPTITGETSYSYFVDTGAGFTYTYTTTKPTLTTYKFANLRVYNRALNSAEQTVAEAEGLIPSLPQPTTDGLIAHYPLTGSAQDEVGNYHGTESSASYSLDSEFGSTFNGVGSVTVNSTAVSLATWCSYWINSGAGWSLIKTTTIPSTLTTNKYRDLRLYSSIPSIDEQTVIEQTERVQRPIQIDNGLVAYYPLEINSEDNNYNQYDGTDSVGVTYDGSKATLPDGDTITFPSVAGFVEAYYTKDDIVYKTTTENDLNILTNCTLKEVRKYNRTLNSDEHEILGYGV